jgi:DMSO/TMAO reductase YedYZ molybdopterin-dependent catalytic subunit
LAAANRLPAQKAEVGSFDFSLLDSWTTPADLFFVRDHFATPRVSSAGWKLSVGGAVKNPLAISYDNLIGRARKVLPVTLECAENPSAGGLVSHAEWTGVRLAAVLQQAQPAPEASFVRMSGADGYSRSIPIAKAMHPDTLIAHQMDGEKLRLSHGFPLRAIIPGWYGMDSIKWLRDIELLIGDCPEQDYQRQVRSFLTGTRRAGPVTAINVKSAFSRPMDGAILTSRRFVVRGAAWAGANRVSLVEISTDGGKSWAAARLSSDPVPYAWAFWSYNWKIDGAGFHDLAVRATDDTGQRQPAERVSDRVDGYELNAWQAIRVTVT